MMLLGQNGPPLWIYRLPTLVFVVAFGACVGSFLNVVIYRLPAGMSVTTPPSRCPVCGGRLRWFHNIPIVSWFLLRGQCSFCKARISPQYMMVELLMAVLFAALFVVLYVVPPSTPFWGEIGGPWWYRNGFMFHIRPIWTGSWPAFVAWAFLIAGLVAMFVIDARTFTIPLSIPVFITCTAFAAFAVQGWLPLSAGSSSKYWPIPPTDWPMTGAAVGAMFGLGIGMLLLATGKLRRSFDDYHDYVPEGETFGDYPHARREMMIEIVYLLPAIGLAWAGYALGSWAGAGTVPPVWIQSLGGSLLGYLVGGAVVWAIRIGGSLLFGKEAMGLGDVHMMAAVGAVLGWEDPIWAFFLAPFLALFWVVGSIGVSAMFRRARRELPFGPHLALATFAVIFARPLFTNLEQVLIGPYARTTMPLLHTQPPVPSTPAGTTPGRPGTSPTGSPRSTP